MAAPSYIGTPVSRVDGPAKVTGRAKFAADFNDQPLLHGYVVNSTIARGTIKSTNADTVATLPGVVKVFTHENRPGTAKLNLKYADMDSPPGEHFKPLQDAKVAYYGQPIALIVADSFESARYAASQLRVQYHQEAAQSNLLGQLDQARKPKKGMATLLKPPPPKPKGDVEKALQTATKTVRGRFVHGMEHHNPMELFGTTVAYSPEGKLTIYDKTQGTINTQLYVRNVFGKSFKDVRVLAPYVGGAFGSALRPQYQLFLAVMAALDLEHSVRVTLTRQQMFTLGYRPATVQETHFGANDGQIVALKHRAIGATSRYEDYTEMVVKWTNMLYAAPNVALEYKLVPLDLATPLDMRAPGGVTGIHALECSIDELAYAAGIDPLEFRLRNYTTKDDVEDLPYSSKELAACFRQGAARFGWHDRSMAPRTMARDGKLIGWGVATGIWEAMQIVARAEAILTPDGRLTVQSAVTDIGTGTYTVMAQIAADCMGMDLASVRFELGDSKLPFAPIQGGSFTTATVGIAVKAACEGLKNKLFALGRKHFPENFSTGSIDDVAFRDGKVIGKNRRAISLRKLVQASGSEDVRSRNTGRPRMLKQRKYARCAHAAAFVEVEVDEDLGLIRVTRALTAVAAGRIVNPKTARSQILGGMVWAISKALREETVIDHRYGAPVNANLGEYHMPVHADINQLDVLFVEEKDEIVNDLGIKGLGEIGIVGLVPAIANAVFHATGRRLSNLPIKLEQVMRA